MLKLCQDSKKCSMQSNTNGYRKIFIIVKGELFSVPKESFHVGTKQLVDEWDIMIKQGTFGIPT